MSIYSCELLTKCKTFINPNAQRWRWYFVTWKISDILVFSKCDSYLYLGPILLLVRSDLKCRFWTCPVFYIWLLLGWHKRADDTWQIKADISYSYKLILLSKMTYYSASKKVYIPNIGRKRPGNMVGICGSDKTCQGQRDCLVVFPKFTIGTTKKYLFKRWSKIFVVVC